MKKALCVSLFLSLFLIISSCSAPVEIKKPEAADFRQNAVFKSDDFSFDCEIALTNNIVSVVAHSTKAKGAAVTYDGTKLRYSYNEMQYELNAEKALMFNPAVIIYDVFNEIRNNPGIKTDTLKSGFSYSGSISQGDFDLIQNEDGSYSSLSVEKAGISVEFKKPSA